MAGQQARRDAERKKRQEEEDRVMEVVKKERPPPFQLGQPPNISDEDAYKEYMRRKLVYQEWGESCMEGLWGEVLLSGLAAENSCLREAMKRIKEAGGGE